jgi:hypothetical protein
VCFVQTFKAKQRFGYVELDEIREVTPTIQNCDQTQWKGLNIKSNIFLSVDVFNRRIVIQFSKVTYYDFDLSRFCLTRELYSDLRCLETFVIAFKIRVSFLLDRNLQTFIFHFRTLHCKNNYVLWGYSVRQRSYKQNVFIFRISFVVESFIIMHSMNIVLGHTIKNT